MTTVNTNKTGTQTTSSVNPTAPVKRGRGRPKGSKNKPKMGNSVTNPTSGTKTGSSNTFSDIGYDDL